MTDILERIGALIDQSIDVASLLIGITRITEDFGLNRDLNGLISNPDIFADQIESPEYAEVLASQPEAQVIQTSREHRVAPKPSSLGTTGKLQVCKAAQNYELMPRFRQR